MTDPRPRISAVVITLDEAEMLPGCLRTLGFCDEVLVVDSGSSDGTRELATAAGATVHQHEFVDFGHQRNAALQLAVGDWVFFVDADERVPGPLAREVSQTVDAWQPGEPVTWDVPRRAWALGREMPGVTGGPDRQRRLVRREGAHFEPGRSVHESVNGDSPAGHLVEPLWHLTHRSISEVLAKLDRYSGLEALDLVGNGASVPGPGRMVRLFLADLWRLLVRGRGFAAGEAGVVESMLLAHYRFLVRARHWELTRTPSLREQYRAIDEGIPR